MRSAALRAASKRRFKFQLSATTRRFRLKHIEQFTVQIGRRKINCAQIKFFHRRAGSRAKLECHDYIVLGGHHRRLEGNPR